MSSLVSILNTSSDLKLKSSGGGGLSDGGIVSYSVSLTRSAPVDITPPKGLNWGGLALSPYGSSGDDSTNVPGGVLAVNFDPTNNADVEEYLVLEDGSEVLVAKHTIPAGTYARACFSFNQGLVLSSLNKLRYKEVSQVPLTARLLLKVALVEYDQPSDQV
jgi:hypothetical protein